MTMTYAPTYRYAVGIYGTNYAQPDQMEPAHWAMAETISEVRQTLIRMQGNYARSITETGAGTHVLDTPGYGEPGDGAYIYRVNREHPDFSEVLDEPGDRARHAFEYVDFDYPAYFATFGPRGGLKIERAA